MIEFLICVIVFTVGTLVGWLLAGQHFYEREVQHVKDISLRDGKIQSLNAELIVCHNEILLQSRIDLEIKKATHE